MKRFLLVIAAGIVGLLVPWLFGGFVAWDMNPANWSADGRFLVAFLGVCFAALAGTAAAEFQ